jgi:anti-sigma regulatory factor (Ser/Thr protein kinase)
MVRDDDLRGVSAQTISSFPTNAGYVHEVGFYGSDDQFRELIVPFATAGIESGEPVVFAYDDYKVSLLERWLPDTEAVSYITDASPYATPAKALGSWRDVIEFHLAGGAPRVRIAGNVPHPGYGIPYIGWDRYEAAVDRALGDLPVWAPCLYDTRIAPPDVVETAKRLHHHVVDPAGARHLNETFSGWSRLADFLAPPADPLVQSAPTLELIDPGPAAVRAAISELVVGRLGVDQVGAVVLAVSEALANALIHGVAPVSVRVWLTDGRVVIQVHDQGPGPADPLVGLLPLGDLGADSGRGLWIAHQLEIDVALIADETGFTVRLRTDLAR